MHVGALRTVPNEQETHRSVFSVSAVHELSGGRSECVQCFDRRKLRRYPCMTPSHRGASLTRTELHVIAAVHGNGHRQCVNRQAAVGGRPQRLHDAGETSQAQLDPRDSLGGSASRLAEVADEHAETHAPAQAGHPPVHLGADATHASYESMRAQAQHCMARTMAGMPDNADRRICHPCAGRQRLQPRKGGPAAVSDRQLSIAGQAACAYSMVSTASIALSTVASWWRDAAAAVAMRPWLSRWPTL